MAARCRTLCLCLQAAAVYAHIHCPCLSQFPTNGTRLWQLQRIFEAQGREFQLGEFATEGNSSDGNCTLIALPQQGGVYCYPARYGLDRCATHDEGLTPYCDGPVEKRPQWCKLSWCYVDPKNCNARSEETAFFPLLNLHYSYVACGKEDWFTVSVAEARFKATLAAQPIRVAYGQEEPPYLFKDGKGKWTGVLVDFTAHLAREVGFTLTEVSLSNESEAKFGDTARNTACANDIALGFVDLCVGNIWESADRVRLAHALPAWWEEQLHLITFISSDKTFKEELSHVFSPFSPALWAFLLFTIVLYSMLMWWAEGQRPGKNGPVAFKSLYLGFRGFLAAANEHRPATVGGRLIALGFSCLVLITTASYTANLASFLLQNNIEGSVNTFQEVVDRGLKFCTWEVLGPSLDARYPRVTRRMQSLSSYADGFESMGKRCAVQMIPPFAYDMAVGGLLTPNDPKKHCDKVLVGRPVTSINSVALTSRPLHMALSYFMVKHRYNGELDQIRLRPEYALPRSQCPSSKPLASRQMTVGSMLGTVVLAGSLMLAGVLVSLRARRGDGGGGPCAGVAGTPSMVNPARSEKEAPRLSAPTLLGGRTVLGKFGSSRSDVRPLGSGGARASHREAGPGPPAPGTNTECSDDSDDTSCAKESAEEGGWRNPEEARAVRRALERVLRMLDGAPEEQGGDGASPRVLHARL